MIQSLANKRECSTGSEIAFNHLHFISLGHELNIERTSDSKGCSNRCGITFHLLDGLHIQLLCGKNDGRVTTVYTSILQVLSDSIVENMALIGDGIKLNLLCIKNELGHNDRFVSRNVRCKLEEVLQLTHISGNTHSCSGKDKTGTNQDWETDQLRKISSFLF